MPADDVQMGTPTITEEAPGTQAARQALMQWGQTGMVEKGVADTLISVLNSPYTLKQELAKPMGVSGQTKGSVLPPNVMQALQGVLAGPAEPATPVPGVSKPGPAGTFTEEGWEFAGAEEQPAGTFTEQGWEFAGE